MEFYEVLEKRRTYRDFSDREVSDELLKRVIGAAFKAPTNDHLRQLEFIVVRGRENIARIITPLAKNMAAFKDLVFEADDSGDKDKRAMFADALPKQQKMLLDSGLLILPFFRQKQSPLLEPAEQSSLNYFASAWCAVENMLLAAAAEVGIARGNRFPSIALTAKGGAASNSIKGLTSANPWAWDALGSLTLPVFNFGRLRRAEQAAMERYTQSALTYEQTVLTAFSDVEQALVAITTYRRQTERYGELVLANDRIAAMTQALYRSGLSDYLDVIDAQRSLYQSQMEFVNLVAQQYINYVNLCKALGGGW